MAFLRRSKSRIHQRDGGHIKRGGHTKRRHTRKKRFVKTKLRKRSFRRNKTRRRYTTKKGGASAFGPMRHSEEGRAAKAELLAALSRGTGPDVRDDQYERDNQRILVETANILSEEYHGGVHSSQMAKEEAENKFVKGIKELLDRRDIPACLFLQRLAEAHDHDENKALATDSNTILSLNTLSPKFQELLSACPKPTL